MALSNTLRGLLSISRPVYSGSTLVFFGLGVFIVEFASSGNEIATLPGLLGYAGALLVVWSAYAMNTLCDKDTDAANPSAGKDVDLRKNPLLTGELGRREVLVYVFVLALSGLGLLVASSYRSGVAAAIGLAGSFLYSAKPLRLKGKPFLDVATIATLDACLFTSGLLVGTADLASRVDIIVFMWLFSLGHTFPTIAEDTEPDRAAGLRTTSVVLGDARTHGVALVVATIAAAYGVWLAVVRYDSLPCRLAMAFILLNSLALIGDYVYGLVKRGFPLRLSTPVGPWYGWVGHGVSALSLVLAFVLA
ncbi:MAG: UbiA family prenyltransferase [Planctomycetes bacterium]|nr:UbiA family prenyltransferase [Planctomycetota bacterium]